MSMASFSRVMWKVTVLLVVAAVLVSGDQHHRGGPGGRFLVDSESEYNYGGAGGRRLLNLDLCGTRGRAPDFECPSKMKFAKQPRCCQVSSLLRTCIDVGDDNDGHCGACNNRCASRLDCCNGQCVNKDTDRNNCGKCGRRCASNFPCQKGFCGYNGKEW